MKKVEMAELRAVVAGTEAQLGRTKIELSYSITLPIFGYGKLQIGFGEKGFGWNFMVDGIQGRTNPHVSSPVVFTSDDFFGLIRCIFDFSK